MAIALSRSEIDKRVPRWRALSDLCPDTETRLKTLARTAVMTGFALLVLAGCSDNEEPCTPTTCSALGYTCGTWANGTCPGTINCGTCGPGMSCIAGHCEVETTYQCGNGITEPGEACDGSDLDGYTCATVAAGFVSGTLICNANCLSYSVAQCVRGNTINAASCSQVDVQAAIDSANDGDTVVVPAGSCTWTTPSAGQPAVAMNSKKIVLQGAGIDQTLITDGTGTDWNEILIGVNCVEGKPFRVRGFDFPGPGSGEPDRIYVAGTCKNWRIDHCRFETMSAPPKDQAIETNDYTYGVMEQAAGFGDFESDIHGG
jgi:hypothetical protein